MKLSESNLHEYIQLYLNDIEDYDSSEQHMLAESALEPVKNLIVESKADPMTDVVRYEKRGCTTR